MNLSNHTCYKVASALAGLLLLLSRAHAAPNNDFFSKRLVLSGASVAVTNDNTRATFEPGEPRGSWRMAKATLWYEWTAPENGFVHAVATGDGFLPLIAVYQGISLKTLWPVAARVEMGQRECTNSFPVKARQKYVLSIDGYWPHLTGRGSFTLALDLTTLRITNPAPNAVVSAAAPPRLAINEPTPAIDGSIASVSYLTRQFDGRTRLVGVSTQAPFAVTPTNLPPGLVSVFAVATTQDGRERVSGPVALRVRPANDHLAQALPLTGYEWETSGCTALATLEKGEPVHGPNGRGASVWWTWTAPASGTLDVEAQLDATGGALRRREVVMYTGETFGKMKRLRSTLVQRSDYLGLPEILRFEVAAGTTYHLAVAARSPNADAGLDPFVLHGKLTSGAFLLLATNVFDEPADVPLTLATTEPAEQIRRVDFLVSDGYVTNQLIGSVSHAPYCLIWSNAPPGNYTVEARVVRADGLQPLPAATSVSIRPENDQFTNRIIIQTNFAWLSHRIAGATLEPDEPYHNTGWGGGATWWSWTAPAAGWLYLGDPTGKTSAGLVVYTGTNLLDLKPVSRPYMPVTAQVTAGTTYHFAVIPVFQPAINFQLRFYPRPPNADFTQRTALSGVPVEWGGQFGGAMPPPSFEHPTPEQTLWWTWTAPVTGSAVLENHATTLFTTAVFTGDSLGVLRGVFGAPSYYGPATFDVVAGTSYQIALSSWWGNEGPVVAGLSVTPSVTNDAFSAAVKLEGTNLTFQANLRGASVEANEPSLPPEATGHTVWWSWTAPAKGNVYLGVGYSWTPFNQACLEVFEGETLAGLKVLPGGGGYRTAFVSGSNVTYHIRCDTRGSAGDLPVELAWVPAPPNDDFAHAPVLSGLNCSLAGTVRGASRETNDPPVETGDRKSVWFSWTAPETGPVTVAVSEAEDYCSVYAYTGDQLGNLAPAGGNNYHDSLVLQAQAGVTYHFLVTAPSTWEPEQGTSGKFRLLLMPGDVPSNDAIANAILLTGTTNFLVATNWAGSFEAAEPMEVLRLFQQRRTLWYGWQAPAAGLLRFTNAGSTTTPIVLTFSGTNVVSRQRVRGQMETPVRAQDWISFLVDGVAGSGGVLQLGMEFLPAPPHDDYGEAEPVAGSSAILHGSVYTATPEPVSQTLPSWLEYRNIWWAWTAPCSAPVVITNLNSGSNALFAVFVGDCFTNSQRLASNLAAPDRRSLQFEAQAGVTYHIEGAWNPGADEVLLGLNQELPVEGAGIAEALRVPTGKPVIAKGLSRDANGRFGFHITGAVGSPYTLEWSSDLIHWETCRTGVLTNGSQEVIESGAQTNTARFYRLLSQ